MLNRFNKIGIFFLILSSIAPNLKAQGVFVDTLSIDVVNKIKSNNMSIHLANGAIFNCKFINYKNDSLIVITTKGKEVKTIAIADIKYLSCVSIKNNNSNKTMIVTIILGIVTGFLWLGFLHSS